MKTPSHFSNLFLAALGAAVLAGPPVARGLETDRERPVDTSTYNQKISGLISARTDNSLTINGTIIVVPATTVCTKNGNPFMLADLKVGDQVNVTAFRDPSTRRLRAGTVDVITEVNGGS